MLFSLGWSESQLKKDKRYQNENWLILYEITETEQKRPKNFQATLHNDHLKKALAKFVNYST